MWTYKKVQGNQVERPLEVDTESTPNHVYLRKNIKQVVVDNVPHWEYDECMVTKEQYEKYMSDLSSPILTTIMQAITEMQLQLDMMS